MYRLILLFHFFFIGVINAQNCPCCTEYHDQFDFWEGEWVVTDTLDNIIGYNTIVKEPGNCLLREHWRGTSGGSGRSMNYFDPADSTWNQLWVSGNGFILRLKGGLSADGKSMQLYSEWHENKEGQNQRHQITWRPISDDELIQEWQIVNQEGEVQLTFFYGVYRKEEKGEK